MESNERVEVILDLFREGHSAEEIADLLGYKGKGGVSGYMRRHGYRFDWTLKNYVKDPLNKVYRILLFFGHLACKWQQHENKQ